MSPALLQVAQKMGGIAAGAFDGDRLVGFVFGISGLRQGVLAHWSHMLAVDERWRDAGIGRRLKQYQREQLLAAGVRHMFWTFDPLVARNANLNLQRLGAHVVEYVRNMYGEDALNRSDAVIGTDRFVVRWDLDRPAPAPAPGAPARPPIRSETDPLPAEPVVWIAIPDDVQQLKLQDPAAAQAWRRATRRAFEHYVGAGYGVTGFTRAAAGGGPAYRLEATP